MVLLRELDDAKDYPAVIHPLGSDWERQVRAHYTRADGTLNINGYYSEMFGFTVKSSDFESGSSDSDSDSDSSGNDSDCVIISSSEFSSKNPNNHSLIVADSVATISTSMEISSRFTTDEFVSTFRQVVQVSGEGGENRVVIDPVALGEFVTTVNEQEPHYFYMYTHVLQTLHLWLPFKFFECQVLRVMNVAPCQLHPNSWAFLKAFQVACEGLDLVPTSGVFFSFFHVKKVSPHSLISISSQPNKGRFSLYASNFKNYRDTFVRFRCGEGFPELMFDASGNHLFPFYWSSSPHLIKGTRPSTLNEYERLAVSTLSKFQVLSSVELISREDKPRSLGEYMSSMSTISAQQRATLVMKARAQKAEAERAAASADAMSQLVVEESGIKSTKRKNSEGPGRIPVAIPKKMKVTVVGEEENEDDDEPLKPRRSKGRGRKRNLSPSLFTKDLDSFDVVNYGFQKYARTSSLSDLSSEDLKQAATDHHIQGALLTYYLSNRQEHESIDSRNKMESADTSLSALEKEFVAAKNKFEEDLAAVKAEQEEKVKAAVKAKKDEVVVLKGKLTTVEDELTEERAKAKIQQEEASLNVEALTGRIEKLEVQGASQFDERFKFALEQVKVAFPDVDVVKLGELDSINQIVEGKIVPYVLPPSE
ncbi:hypothetical protein TSUD_67630 [Trifolium subterraneum]|uniref:Transposase (putative) gypsy type domain-containing protein n=1 Tax=Trifolium subterraneum TaxID=3900 RepID=A0A2Z6MEB9_TRISU|nr:hypothetical protein TSUD_67630 [Trifolium subterraneum]